MRRTLLALAAATGLAGLSGAASAQGFGIYVGPDRGFGYGYDEPSVGVEIGPRVYGYSRRDRYEPRYERRDGPYSRPSGRNGCGVNHYWDGYGCADARDK
jgi:hypothetical protein